MKSLFISFLFLVLSHNAFAACPDLEGRYVCESSFGEVLKTYTQLPVGAYTEYKVISRLAGRNGEETDIFVTDNVLRQNGRYQVRSWCEDDKLWHFMFREWGNFRQTHKIMVFINRQGDLEKHDFAKFYRNGELDQSSVHKGSCRRVE